MHLYVRDERRATVAKHFKKDGVLQQASRFDAAARPGREAGEPTAAQMPQDNPYVPHTQDNPYAAGPASGAVGVTPERAGKAGAGRGGAGQGVPGAARKRHRRVPVVAVVLVVLAVLVGAGALLYLNPPIYRVSVNGVEHMIHTGMTLQDLVDEGWATPAAGDLIAVDGSVAQEGGGDKFEANLNGTVTSDPATTVPRHSTVEFSDGNDVDEDYTETTEAIAHGEGGQDVGSPATYYAGPIHVLSDGQDGEQVTKTGKVSGKTVTEVTKQPVDSGYSAYSVNTNGDKVIALTFDDGPWPTTTSEILDVLKEYGVTCTFFVVGNWADQYPEQAKAIVDSGNELMNHSNAHDHYNSLTADQIIADVNTCNDKIEALTGVRPTLIRCPFGEYDDHVISTIRSIGMEPIQWDVEALAAVGTARGASDMRAPYFSSRSGRCRSAGHSKKLIM